MLWDSDPSACCGIRKVAPLRKALAGFDAWISGRKRFHGDLRAFMPVIELSGAKIKINPLARWSKVRIEEEFARHDLPRHPLEADGFLSIGCLPCTDRVAPAKTSAPAAGPAARRRSAGFTCEGLRRARWRGGAAARPLRAAASSL